MGSQMFSKYRLGLFSLIMIAVVSVDSLRNLPIAAQYGYALITFYMLAGVTFFFPLAWIAGRLATLYPNTGGSYVWIEKAFGKTAGYLSIWLQWIYNMIWYPTIFAFINATFASIFFPQWQNNRWFILFSSLFAFWFLSLLHCFGLRSTRWLSAFGAIIGTLLPMLLLIVISIHWLVTGKMSQTPFSISAFIPDEHSLKNLAFFSNILFSLIGLEVITMHAGNVNNPKKTYPQALWISSILILFTLMFSSIALCIIMPANNIALISGLMDVYKSFFAIYQIPYGATLIGACIVIGGLAITSSWMVGLARGLQVALLSNNAPYWIHRLNNNDMPSSVLFIQATLYSFLLIIFVLFPNISESYWVLSALSAQFALLYYILLFAAAYRLLKSQARRTLDQLLITILVGIASLICITGIVVGFLPPENLSTTNPYIYEFCMIMGFIVIALLPVILVKKFRK